MSLFSNINFSTSFIEDFNLAFSCFKAISQDSMSSRLPLFRRLRTSLKCCTSFYSFQTRASSVAFTSLTFTFTITCFAQSANFKVLIVSSAQSYIGEIVAIKQVLVFPPRESYKSRVNFESQYGTKCSFCPMFILQCHLFYLANPEITFPKVVKERLIVQSS